MRFLRSTTGRDPVHALWELDLTDPSSPVERCLIDPRDLEGVVDGDETPEERARRERARDSGSGVTTYATDVAGRLVALVVGGRLITLDTRSGSLVEHPQAAGAFDPRPSPDGSRVAYAAQGAVHVLDVPSGASGPGATRTVISEEGVRWGVAEFVAAEEMGRSRGFWWSGDGERLAVTRVDERDVDEWFITDPAQPWAPAKPHRYPAAGRVNADVRLAVLSVDGAHRVDVEWDRLTHPYLTRVSWDVDPDGDDRLVLQVQSRDQRSVVVLRADPARGTTVPIRQVGDDGHALELVAGSPAWCGRDLVTVEDVADHGRGGSRALLVAGEVVTPARLQVRGIVGSDDRSVTFTGSDRDPTSVHVWRWDRDRGLDRLTGAGPAVHGATVGSRLTVLTRVDRHRAVPHVTVVGAARPVDVEVVAEDPALELRVEWLTLTGRRLRAALLLPEGADGPLPVVLDPYGGPHAQRVLSSAAAMLSSQWLADQGFAVLVVDGRGTPGRGPAWERAVHGDLAGPVLADQLAALRAAARHDDRLDLDRVGIRGWSFGGYLAALAALRAPRVIRAAIVGAPVADWRLYDTHYTERYLGDPAEAREAYDASSLVDDAGRLTRTGRRRGQGPELLVIHGLSDDNVVAAHSLRLSGALLAEGWRHQFVPLPGITHMTPQPEVARRLQDLQVDFLRRTLHA